MIRRCISGAVAAAFLLCSASLLSARPGRVVLKDGKSFEGEVTERDAQGQVDVVVDGKKMTFSRGAVARIDPIDPPEPAGDAPRQPGGQAPQGMSEEQEFEKRMAAMGPRDVAGRVKLARWAFDRQRYDMARAALEQAVRIDPRNREAQDFLRTVDAQQRLNQRQGNRPPQQGQPGGQGQNQGQAGTQPPMEEGGDDQPPGQPRGPRAQGGGSASLRPLTPDEINRIRMMEWRPDDRGVNIRLLNNVKRRFLARARDVKPAEFNAMNVTEQALLIREQGTEDMVNDVRIVNDPPSMAEFRTGIQRPVLSTCASQQCHGGGAGSEKFALFHRADKEPEAYANFLALNNYTGTAGGGSRQPQKEEQEKKEKQKKEGGSILSSDEPREGRMIDRNRPEDSLLIQYGLPRDAADVAHPEVQGFKPLFRTRNDARYRQFVDWVANSLSPMDEDYGIDLGGGAAEQAGGRQGAGGQPQEATDQQPAADEGEGGNAPPPPAPAGRQPARGAQGQRPAGTR